MTHSSMALADRICLAIDEHLGRALAKTVTLDTDAYSYTAEIGIIRDTDEAMLTIVDHSDPDSGTEWYAVRDDRYTYAEGDLATVATYLTTWARGV